MIVPETLLHSQSPELPLNTPDVGEPVEKPIIPIFAIYARGKPGTTHKEKPTRKRQLRNPESPLSCFYSITDQNAGT